MNFYTWFQQAFDGHTQPAPKPYAYQTRLALERWPDLLDVPTGMGKTAAVTLAWLWKRGWRHGERGDVIDDATPRRLVWCLPMRVLVEQTRDNIQRWLDNLGIRGNVGDGKVSAHVLMGGADDLKSWAEHPEEDMVLIGTQDMLLSRALMRGYGMSRYQWPIHFALLHNDAMWVFDEVQLMGAGLATSTQLEAFRRRFARSKPSCSLWVSATLHRDWLDTIDFRPHLKDLATQRLNDDDRHQAGAILGAVKTLTKLDIRLTAEAGSQAGMKTHLAAMRDAILGAHDTSSQTLVIVNRVDRAQQLFRLLRAARPNRHDLLIHSRFRADERAVQAATLRDGPTADRIVVATQAIEAGVDVSSKVLVTELAPWPSLVQRFGRCNRDGKHNSDGAHILWIDIEPDKELALPYSADELAAARTKLEGLHDVSPQALPASDTARPTTAVLRRKDLLDLFNTDPDLSGFDVDVSDYIRDSDRPGVQVFWRDFKENPNESDGDGRPEGRPDRLELCPISMSQAKGIQKRGAWYWDTLGDRRHHGRWSKLDREPRPGMTLLLRASDGGYDDDVGFDGNATKLPVRVVAHSNRLESAFESDERTQIGKWVSLPRHLADAASQAAALCRVLAASDDSAKAVVRAARWHDLGKAHEAFQCALAKVSTPPAPRELWAKSDQRGRLVYQMCRQEGAPRRQFFRHELASMLGWLAQHDGEPQADLVAYLIAAHHGKVRMSLRAMPTETAAPGVKRFARGVWEGDTLPSLDFDGEHSDVLELKLALMALGTGEQGASWTERTLTLLDQYGPFQLAWLETLVRLADWRASAAEQRGDTP